MDRSAAKRLARTMAARVLRRAAAVLPKRHHVVLYAFPETEGNGTEMLRALVHRYTGGVVWLVSGSPGDVDEDLARRCLVLPKIGLRALWSYLTAEVVFFTHGLYGAPQPLGRQPSVNLWHGDGPKDELGAAARGRAIPSTFIVGNTRLFTGLKAQAFAVPDSRVLVTGNPRTDVFWRSVPETVVRDLGITPPFVLWMPTFRRSISLGATASWSDMADDPASAVDVAMAEVVEKLRSRGVQVVTKPHPMDAEPHTLPGAVTVRNEDLSRAGLPLYSLLAASAGLVTDYSSVWVDYLLLDKPIGFLVSDREAYQDGRGLNPGDVLNWLPGESLDTGSAAVEAFVADVLHGGRAGARRRAATSARIGLNGTHTAADDLLDALAQRGVLLLSDVARALP